MSGQVGTCESQACPAIERDLHVLEKPTGIWCLSLAALVDTQPASGGGLGFLFSLLSGIKPRCGIAESKNKWVFTLAPMTVCSDF